MHAWGNVRSNAILEFSVPAQLSVTAARDQWQRDAFIRLKYASRAFVEGNTDTVQLEPQQQEQQQQRQQQQHGMVEYIGLLNIEVNQFISYVCTQMHNKCWNKIAIAFIVDRS
jgi:dihydroorotate dehydrogenase